MGAEDIIPVVIIILFLFGNGIKKLLQKLAQKQRESGSSGSSGRRTASSTPTVSEPAQTSSQRSSKKKKEPVRLDRGVQRQKRQTSAQQTAPAGRGQQKKQRQQEKEAREQLKSLREEQTGGKDRGVESREMEDMAERKWSEAPPVSTGSTRRSAGGGGLSGEELDEKMDRIAGDSPLKKGIIWSEILGSPVSRRRRGGRLLPHQEER